MTERIRVLHVIPAFYPAVRYGGPIESVWRLTQALSQYADVEVMTTNADGADTLTVPLQTPVDVQGVVVRYYPRLPLSSVTISPALLRALSREIKRFQLVHVTATFSLPSTAACLIAREAKVPYVVSPRGGCRAWAMQQKRWKKLPYWHLVEKTNLKHAAGIHTTSTMEQSELEVLLPSTKSFLVPNGVMLPETTPTVERSPRRVLFLGRMHPVKALDQLLAALSLLALRMPGVEAVFAGPDDVGEWQRLSKLLAELMPRPNVRFLGPVHGAPKTELLASASVLVLPSHSENFGQVVVEALAHGTPVIASRHTPWQILETNRAGLWVPNDAASLADAMYRVLAEPQEARRMGEAGRRLAHEFGWPAVARDMAENYARCIEQARGGA